MRVQRPLPCFRTIAPLASAILCALLPAAATAGDPLFPGYYEALYGYSSGYTWYAVAGDLDLDGRDDLVRINAWSSPALMLVRFGEPNGRLTGQPLALPLPASLSSSDSAWPCIDDLDGDGQPDIVIGADTEIVVLRGLGGRAFAAAVTIAEHARGYVSATDLNGDGKPDCAFVNPSAPAPDTVEIRFGAGGLAFTPGPAFAISAGAPGVHLRDFNGDQLPDVFVGAGGTSTLLLNLGGGAFSRFDVTANYAFPAGDLNGDGFEDLVSTTAIHLGKGDGTFEAPIPHGMGSPEITADLNEDGRPDLVGSYFASPSRYVDVRLGQGDGTFGPQSLYRTCLSTGGYASGDFDQDGHADLVITGWDVNLEAFMFGTGAGGFRQRVRSIPSGIYGNLAAGNLGADSHPDLVVAGTAAPTVAVLLSQGTMQYAAPVNYPALAVSSTVTLGDLDHDGLDDVVVGYSNVQSVSVWLTQPGGALGPRNDIASAGGTKWLRLADLDADGSLDLVSAFREVALPNDSTGWWRHGNGDGTFGPTVWLPGHLGIGQTFDVVDLDGNGALDLVAVGQGYGARVMLATSPGVFPGFTDYSSGFAASFAGTGYFDADTIRDVVVSSDSLWLYRGLGGGLLAPKVSLGYGAGPLAAVADFNLDGLTDAAGPPSGSQFIRVSLGTGGRMSAMTAYGIQFREAGMGAYAVADLDGNGAPDIAVSELQRDFVTVLLNQVITPNVGVEPTPRPAIRLAVSATPNPAVAGRVSLRLALASAAPVEVHLFDLSGRRVGGASVARPAGRDVAVSLAGTERLAPGLYLVRVRQGGEAASARVCVVR